MEVTHTTYVVLRRFPVAPGRMAEPGDVLDTQDWPVRRAGQLVDQRYLAPAPRIVSKSGDAPVRRREG